MTPNTCAACEEPFIPREAKQRFCCRQCSINWWSQYRAVSLAFYRQYQQQQHQQQRKQETRA
jgi:hypothetical protein